MQLHAHIHKDTRPFAAEYPWEYTVDYVTPEFPKGDFSRNSYDYGSVETFERAMACVEWVFAEACKAE